MPEAYQLRDDPHLGCRVCPLPVRAELAEAVARSHRITWPTWIDRGPRMLRHVLELCRLRTARGLALLHWLAADLPPGELDWFWLPLRLTGPRQDRMYAAAAAVPAPVLALVVANWTWVLASPHGGRITASYLAGAAYRGDGFLAADATMTLYQTYDRHPEARPALAAAWAAARVGADWCNAADLSARYQAPAPVFTYPRDTLPPPLGVRPWIQRLFRLE
ncbi:hypothetical protein [Nonomuraea roseoviolacea]|uniref:Uncharacterized protein n=1 Tax=Nonomuraea roseoviolacea subsp. carminata TaxID=160689 RepID=A0ABT1K0Y7_9ACTN|nr:hypothetical protein [Nonomuraea roseoviolacea]MCP2347660.1 hypothetical protein [Nonomuraea roseoviolacea subsp. carminata]